MAALGIGLYLKGPLVTEAGQFPLGAPRDLRWEQDDKGITFTWQPPVSFGEHGPASLRYGYQFRFNTAGRADARDWAGEARQDENTENFAWVTQADGDESVQLQVRAWDADGNASAWTTSRVIMERQTGPAPSGPFSREFSEEFEGGV